jgi:putative salt-induced outer membrane protein YdiY
VPALAIDPLWFQPRHCLSTRCGDEEWRREVDGQSGARVTSAPRRPRLPGVRSALPLTAPARSRESHATYSNDWRIGTRYGYQVVRERDVQFGVELGAGYRIAPLNDDGVAVPGPVFRGGINFGRRFGERAQWTQRLQFEAGNGERFALQTIGVDVELAPAWMLESDYLIRYDSRGASGSDTAEAWFGVRRLF